MPSRGAHFFSSYNAGMTFGAANPALGLPPPPPPPATGVLCAAVLVFLSQFHSDSLLSFLFLYIPAVSRKPGY